MIRSIMLMGFAVALLAGIAFAADGARTTLTAPARFQGYECAPGPAWFYEGGKLKYCKLAHDGKFGDYTVPAGSWIHLRNDSTPEFVLLAHDTKLGKLLCRGNGAESYSTALHPNGRLKECWLAGDQIVQGIPCQGATFLTAVMNNASARLYDNGRLESCVLSTDFNGTGKGLRLAAGD